MYSARKRSSSPAEKRSNQVAKKQLPRKTKSQSANSLFLIDGNSPVQPYPQLVGKTTKRTTNGPGRHRSVDVKGHILELIDETYPPLLCPECYHTSSGRSEADLHFKEQHHGRKVFQCVSSACEQAYSTKAGLRYHLEHVHQVTLLSGRQANLQKRRKSTAAPSTLPQRQPRKTSPIQQTTDNISKRFKKDQLSDQLQKELDDTYPTVECPACKEEFKKKTHVITHLVDSHQGEEPYKCIVPDCKRTKKYATREGLLYHLVTYHNNE